jgi:hypothetical protein
MVEDRQQSPRTDVKTTQVSKKVWSLEGTKPSLVNINADGTIPTELYKTMKSNTVIPTDYVDNSTNERTHLYKINNRIYKISLVETES